MNDIQTSIKERYSHLHPLLIQRSAEKAHNNGELFDLLDGMPKEYPIVWCTIQQCWIHTDDLLQGLLTNAKDAE